MFEDSDAVSTGSATSLTISALSVPNANRAVVAWYGERNGDDVFTSMTCDGNAMTLWSVGELVTTFLRSRAYYLTEGGLNAGTTQDIVCTVSSAQNFCLGAASVSDVADQAPESVASASTNNATSQTANDDTITDDAVGVCFFHKRNTEAHNATGDFTARQEIFANNISLYVGTVEGTGAAPNNLSESFSWAAGRDAHEGIFIFEAGGGGGGGSPLLALPGGRRFFLRGLRR